MGTETGPVNFQHKNPVFITGGTGYIGSRLINSLISKGFRVVVLVRPNSQSKVSPGAEIIIADPFDAESFQNHIPTNSIFVQLLGVPHPSPKKASLFKQIDLVSVTNSIAAASYAQVCHFVYVSVSMEPSSIMQAYQKVRRSGEEACIRSGLNCTFIRPWYVIGPGNIWPVILLPFYAIASIIPALRKKAAAFGLVTIVQMIKTLVRSVESEPMPLNIIEIPAIRKA